MAADHIGIFRAGLSWGIVDMYGFAAYDEMVAELARHHMTMVPILFDPPLRYTTRPPQGPYAQMYPPKRFTQFASFAARVVRRYGRDGTFWRSNPRVPYYPVQAWQIWNEPNLKIYWGGAPNACAYSRMLRLTYAAIKKVSRSATVVMAGEPYATQYSVASSFYTALYKCGARKAFDVLALHDYAPNPPEALLRLQIVRGIMNAFHDQSKPIWVTEVGWASSGPPPPYSPPYIAGLNGQRKYLLRFFGDVQRYRRSLGIGKVFWYGWRDVNWKVVGTPDFWGYHTSLLTYALQPKPALSAFVAVARRLNG
jgi:hypothetical protein